MANENERLRDSTTGHLGLRTKRLRLIVRALFVTLVLTFAILAAYKTSAPDASSPPSSGFWCAGSHCDTGFGSDDIVFVVYNATNGQISYFASMEPAWASDYVDMWNRPRNETGLPTDHALLNVTGDPNWRTCFDDRVNGQMDLWIVDLKTLKLTRTR